MRWFVGATILLVLGIVFQLGLLVYAMYALLGVMLLSRFLTREWIENLSATRECSRDTAEIGDKVALAVNIRNSGVFPIPWLLLEDSLPHDALVQRPPRIKVDGRRMGLIQLRPLGEKSLLYQVNFLMRGYYQIGPLLIESGDLFGLHRRYKVVTEPQFILVLPKIIPLVGYDLMSRRPIGEVRITHRLFEDPTRISGVREYQAGDALNRVHWKATARTGILHSKVFEPSSVAGATIVLDFHRESYPSQGEPHRSELGITTAASLANAVQQMGQQIGLVSNGRDAADRVRQEGWKHEFRTRAAAKENFGMQEESDRLQPVTVATRRGTEQLTYILETLARLELTDGLTFPQLLIEATSRMPRDATVIAILSEVTEETAIALGNLKRQGFSVTAVLILDDDTKQLGTSGPYQSQYDFADSAGRLMAEGINFRRADNEAAISALCSQQLIPH